MIDWVVRAMIYLGSALMVYNIYGFVHFARRVQRNKDWGRGRIMLYVPIALLVMFLLGYLAVGLFGNPDLIISGILFGGSIFVFIMFLALQGITDRIQQQEQMEAKLTAAEASNEAKSAFLASMSHELRTPMNAILGLDSILLGDQSLAPQVHDRLEKIGVSARHMMELINDLLDMNRIESGQLILKSDVFSVREMLELMNLLIRTRCEEAGLEYRYEATGDADQICIGDGMRLKQVLLGILDNAVKFTPPPGTVTFSAEVTLPREDRCALRFTVRDTGIGMDDSFLPHLFESFTQEDSSSTSRYGGRGLGMAIARRVLNMMGGTISAESRKGKGSAFFVNVELQRVDRSADGGAAKSEANDRALGGRRVLIAEDIDLNADIVSDLLELEDVASERARNGREAVEMFCAQPPRYYDAILMDLRMPVMDGLEATRRIRALDRPDARTVPIVALTANAYEEDVRRSLDAGMNAHLSKPADSALLYETLAGLIAEQPSPGASDLPDGDRRKHK